MGGFADDLSSGYGFEGASVRLGRPFVDPAAPENGVDVRILLGLINRHGLIAGATGTGKTKTLQLIAELDALAKEGAAKFHFAAYAPPSLVVFRNQLYLQVTLRNPAPFDKERTSLYKRAAQSFDLFLAPLLKDLLAKTPPVQKVAGLDVTVLIQFTSGGSSSASSEAVEYICSMGQLRRFTEYEITNQELLDQSFILVNGVRIALNLQQVE